MVVASDLRNSEMCSHTLVRVNHLGNLHFSPGRVEVYLPKRPLLDIESRLSLHPRPSSLDAQDLLLNPLWSQHPLNQSEKMDNAILSVGLKATDVDGNPLTFCHNLQIRVQPKDASVAKVLKGTFVQVLIYSFHISLLFFSLGVYYFPPTIDGLDRSKVCAFVRVVGLREGFTELEVFYHLGENIEEQTAIAQFPIGVYKDISFVPKTATSAVAVGSSSRISVRFVTNLVVFSLISHFVHLWLFLLFSILCFKLIRGWITH